MPHFVHFVINITFHLKYSNHTNAKHATNHLCVNQPHNVSKIIKKCVNNSNSVHTVIKYTINWTNVNHK